MTLRQLAPLFGVSKSAAGPIIGHLAPSLALQPRKRSRRDTVLIVNGTLVPLRDHTVAEQPEPGQTELPDWREEHTPHEEVEDPA